MDLQLDLDDVQRGLDAVWKRQLNLRPLWRHQGPRLRRDQRQHFEQRSGPYGGWAPRAPSSVKKILARRKAFFRSGKVKKKFQRRLGNQLGRLKTALRLQTDRRGMEIGPLRKIRWASVHQTGGTVGRGSQIPAREFVWISDEFLDSFMVAYKQFVMAAWWGR